MSRPGALTITTPTDRELVITRAFSLRKLVWDAMTTPDLIRRWMFMPPGWTMVDCIEDLRPGGKFRWTWNGPDGNLAMVLRGEYREVKAPERAVRTEIFEFGCHPMPESVATMALTESGGKTTVIITVLYSDKETRDGALASGMDEGMAAGYNNLEEMLTSAGAKR